MQTKRICITPGEPSGIGPDICLALIATHWPCELVFIVDPDLIAQRAEQLALPVQINLIDLNQAACQHQPGVINIIPVTLTAPCQAGKLDVLNAPYVVETLKKAADLCLDKQCSAIVTGPVQKSIINEANIAFSGHTEFFAQYCGGYPVMMLANKNLRVALATTHLALRKVADAITQPLLERVIKVLQHDFQHCFGIPSPRILVCGLNPHAGESGHLGDEEINIIKPVIDRLRNSAINLSDPLPADTAFTPSVLEEYDVVLAMYHDQGLPVLKAAGFGDSVNITLGLPIIRTSVDHGTALGLAGTGKAEPDSLKTALEMAIELTQNTHE